MRKKIQTLAMSLVIGGSCISPIFANESSDVKPTDKTVEENMKLELNDKETRYVVNFRKDNSDVLTKSVDSVTEEEKPLFERLLKDISMQSPAVKADLKKETEHLNLLLKRANELQEAREGVIKFRESQKDVLQLTEKTVQISDEPYVDKAIAEYDSLPEHVEILLSKDITKLDNLKRVITELKENNSNKKNNDKVEMVTKENKEVINKDKQEIKKDTKKDINTDTNKKVEDKKTEEKDKASEFKDKYKDVLNMQVGKLSDTEKDKLNKALDEYDKLPQEDKNKLQSEKSKLDSLKKGVIGKGSSKVSPKTGVTAPLFAGISFVTSLGAGACSFIYKKRK